MVRAVLTGRLTGLGFDLAWFSSLFPEHLCVFDLHGDMYIFKNFVIFALHFSELRHVGIGR